MGHFKMLERYQRNAIDVLLFGAPRRYMIHDVAFNRSRMYEGSVKIVLVHEILGTRKKKSRKPSSELLPPSSVFRSCSVLA